MGSRGKLPMKWEETEDGRARHMALDDCSHLIFVVLVSELS